MRLATEADVPVVLEMGRKFTAAAGIDADDHSMVTTIAMLLQTNGLFVTGDPIVGMVGAILYPHYLRRERITAQELFWWVEPEARKSGVGRELIEGLETWARDNGAHSLTMIALSASDGDNLGRWYESQGYKTLERHYSKVL